MTRRHAALLASTVALYLAPGHAAAQPVAATPDVPSDSVTTDPSAGEPSTGEPGRDELAPVPLDVHYRTWATSATSPDFAESPDGQQALYQTLRLRLDGQITDAIALRTELDLATGRIVGDSFPLIPEGVATGTTPRGQVWEWPANITDVRALYTEVMTPVGQLRAGLQTSDWGLGILANDGSFDDEDLFGQHYGADRVLRAVFATAPLQATSNSDFAQHFFVALGADMVYRDENADLRRGDRAYQGVLAILYDDEPTRAGAYAVYRHQTDDDEDTLRIVAADIFAQQQWDLADGSWTLGAAAEAALVLGETSRALGANTAEPLGVAALGAASELSARWHDAGLSLHLKSGYASGDANSDDETLYRFRFDPNYQVGLVLFDHYLPAVTREGYRRVSDPSRAATPPKGAEQLIADGAVENAYYLNPQLRFGDPDADGLQTGFGLLWAIAEQPLADPYSSFEAGGQYVGLLGANPASRHLGWEADASVLYRFSPAAPLRLEVKAEYGIFFPGAAFANAEGDLEGPQSLARARIGVLW